LGEDCWWWWLLNMIAKFWRVVNGIKSKWR
jgi:hypothetical protein